MSQLTSVWDNEPEGQNDEAGTSEIVWIFYDGHGFKGKVHVSPEKTKKMELRNYLKNKELLMFKNNKVENYADNWCSDALEFLKHLISGKLMAANGSRCIGYLDD